MAIVFGFWLFNNYNNFGNKSTGNMESKRNFINAMNKYLDNFCLYFYLYAVYIFWN